MKTKTLILFALVLATLQVQCQNLSDSNSFEKKDFMRFRTSAFWSKDFYGNDFFATSYGFDFARKINNKTTLFVGIDMLNCNTKYRDLAPRRSKNGVETQIGITHKFNDKLFVSGSVFYNSFYNSVGADLDVTYKFSDDAFFNFYASFSHTDFWYPYNF